MLNLLLLECPTFDHFKNLCVDLLNLEFDFTADNDYEKFPLEAVNIAKENGFSEVELNQIYMGEHSRALQKRMNDAELALKIAVSALCVRSTAQPHATHLYAFMPYITMSRALYHSDVHLDFRPHNPQHRFLGLAKMLCDAFARYDVVHLNLNVGVLDVEDYRTFVLTPMQAYLVEYLYENFNRAKFLVRLEFTASIVQASGSSDVEFVSAALQSPMPSSLLKFFHRVNTLTRVLFKSYGV